MATLRWEDLFQGPDTTANRPTASSVAEGTLYVNTSTDMVEVSDGSSWTTWFDPEENQ